VVYLSPSSYACISSINTVPPLKYRRSDVRFLVIHPDPKQLEMLSEGLVDKGLPHIAVTGSLDHPEQLLRSIYLAGITEYNEYLSIQTLINGSDDLSLWTELASEHGVVAIVSESGCSDAVADILPPTLGKAAAAGLVPRPVLDNQGPNNAFLLDTVPFAIRAARMQCNYDAGSMFRLQAMVPPSLQKKVVTVDDITETLERGGLGFLVQAEGEIIAAALFDASSADGDTGDTGGTAACHMMMSLQILAIDSAVEQKEEILSSLWQYTLFQIASRNSPISGGTGNDNSNPSNNGVIIVQDNVILSPLEDSMDGALVLWSSNELHKAPDIQSLMAHYAGSITHPTSLIKKSKLRSITHCQQQRALFRSSFPRLSGQELDLVIDTAAACSETVLTEVLAAVKNYMEEADLPTSEIHKHTSLMDAGLDSLDLLKIASMLSSSLGMALPSTLLFDFPTAAAVADHIGATAAAADLLVQQNSTSIAGSVRRNSTAIMSSSQRMRSTTTTAGMIQRPGRKTTRFRSTFDGGAINGRKSGIFVHGTSVALHANGRRASNMLSGNTAAVPLLQVVMASGHSIRLGTATNTASPTQSLFGTDRLRCVPCERWDIEGYGSNDKMPARFGAFLDNVSLFDASLFGISKAEVPLMDPQQRLLLECCKEAATSADLLPGGGASSPSSLGSNKPRRHETHSIGVFVGASYTEYMSRMSSGPTAVQSSSYVASGGCLSVISGRVSYLFGYGGPSLVTDTACSSSLVALNGAHMALLSEQCSAALTGGVNLMLTPTTAAMYHAAGMLAPDGRCKTLDAVSNGYVRAEAVAALALQRIDSISQSDKIGSKEGIVVLILGTAVNQDGKSSTLTAPNGPAQQELIKKALKNATLAATKVSLLQMHGTGTALGDPIEINAALTVLMPKRGNSMLELSAAKASAGHAEPAAGSVGVASLILSLEDNHIPQALHLRQVNPYVQQCLEGQAKVQGKLVTHASRVGAPFALPGSTRIAGGVSAFAFQGTNAHAIVESIVGDGDNTNVGLLVDALGNTSNSSASRKQQWQKESYWLYPLSSGILCFKQYQRKNRGNDFISMTSNLAAAARMMMKPHQLTFLMEAMCQGMNTLLQQGASQQLLCMSDITLHTPVLKKYKTLSLEIDPSSAIIAVELTAGDDSGQNNKRKRRLSQRREERAAQGRLSRCHALTRNDNDNEVDAYRSCALTSYCFYQRPYAKNITTAIGQLGSCSNDGVDYTRGSFFFPPSLLESCSQLTSCSQQLKSIGSMIVESHSSDRKKPWLAADGRSMFSSGDNWKIYLSDVATALGTSRNVAPAEAKTEEEEEEEDVFPIDYAPVKQAMSVAKCNECHQQCAADMAAESFSIGDTFTIQLCPQDKLLGSQHHTAATMQLMQRMLTSQQRKMTATVSITMTAMLKCCNNELPQTRIHTTNTTDITAGIHYASLLTNNTSLSSTVSTYHNSITSWTITGGTGALGMLAQQWIFEMSSVSHVILLGRSGKLSDPSPSPSMSSSSSSLVTISICDISLSSDVVDTLPASPSQGILHAGGILKDAPLSSQTMNHIRTVFAPKVGGLACIKKSTAVRHSPLHAMVLFSSIAAVTGPAGSSNYAAANAVLDQEALASQHQGFASTSVQWGAWSKVGMVAANHGVKRVMERSGIGLVEPYQGVKLLSNIALSVGYSQFTIITAIPYNWSRFMSLAKNKQLHEYSEYLNKATVQKSTPPPMAQSQPSRHVDLYHLIQHVVQLTAAVSGVDSITSPDQPMIQSGLDSLAAVEIRNKLQNEFTISLPATLVFDYPTPKDVATFLGQLLSTSSTNDGNNSAMPATSTTTTSALPSMCKEQIESTVLDIIKSDLLPSVESLDTPLMNAGIDSLSAIELKSMLSRQFDLELPATLLFDYPTPGDIAEFISKTMAATHHGDCRQYRSSMNMAVAACGFDTYTVKQLVVIDHIHRRFPSRTLSQSITTPHHDTCQVTPFSRWDVDSNPMCQRPGGRFGRFIPGVELFDAAAVSMSAAEALLVDPQQRMMLEDSWEILSSWNSDGRDNSIVSVAATMSFWDYSQQIDAALPGTGEAFKATGRCFSVAAGRISFCYGLKGPSMTIDTACSSSLTAVQLIQQLFYQNKSQKGIVTAALLTLDSRTIGMLTAASMLAPDGRCKTLDAAADGYVRGEGCISLGLRLVNGSDASSASSSAVVLGTAVNQDGRSSSLTAPNGPSQQSVMRLALNEAMMSADEVSMLEMHGTGTALGDPIEVGAAAAVFSLNVGSSNGSGSRSSRQCPLELGAAKSRLGHLEPAAGAAGILTAIDKLTSYQTERILHLTTVNPYIASDNSSATTPSMYASRCIGAAPVPSVIGISGFAFQGTNAHIVIGSLSSTTTYEADDSSDSIAILNKNCWHRSRHWFAPPPHPLLERVHRSSKGVIIMQCNMQRLSFLLQHVVKGRSILPGIAMFECALAALFTLNVADNQVPVLTSSSITAPLLLTVKKAPTMMTITQQGTTIVLSSPHSQHLQGQVASFNHQVLYNEEEGDDDPSSQQSSMVLHSILTHSVVVLNRELNQHPIGVIESGTFSSSQHSSSFIAHPAASDSATHLGAMMDSDNRGDGSRVPSTVNCYFAAGTMNTTSNMPSQSMFTSCGNTKYNQQHNDRTSSFSLFSASNGTKAKLADLCSISLQQHKSEPTSTVSEQQCLMYEKVWCVSEDHHHSVESNANRTSCVSLSLTTGTESTFVSEIQGQDSHMFASCLGIFKDVAQRNKLCTLTASIPDSMEGSVLDGLVKVAALELKSIETKLAINSRLRNDAGDAHGTKVIANTRHVPKLLHSHSNHVVAENRQLSTGGALLIAGGTSGIGLLTGLAAASDYHKQQHIILVGS